MRTESRWSVVGGRWSLALLAAMGMMLAGTARGQTEYFVATNGTDNGSNDGLSWAQPLLTISNGVAKAAAAGAGSTVTVSNGTYNISTQITVSAAITIRSFGNGVYGGLANAANTIVRQTVTHNRIMNISGAGAVVDGLTIRDAACDYAQGAQQGRGNGIYMTANALVKNCIIRNNGYNQDRVIGGGVYMIDGTVSNCVVSLNNAGNGDARAAGIYASGGTIDSCRILNNEANYEGGGIVADGSGVVIRNCLISGNTAAATGGGVHIANNGGTIENCTIVGNTASGANGGGGIYRNTASAGTIRNCIVYNNTSGHATFKNSNSGTTTWYNNCTTNPVVAGTACISADPMFRDAVEGNYRLSTDSPCIDTGSNQTWTATGVDLAGKARQQAILGATALVDMGAYEYNAALSCDFAASPNYAISAGTYQCFGGVPFTAQFTGWADGTNLTGVVYRWDFDGDSTWDTAWASGNTASYTYNTDGVYSPKLEVSNTVAEVGETVKTDYVSAGKTYYVAQGASGGYSSWADAGGSIQDALNLCTYNGSQVLVSNGLYAIASNVVFRKDNVILRSYGGGVAGGLVNASNTVVKAAGSTRRAMAVTNVNCQIDGFTLTGGGGNVGNPAGDGLGNSMGNNGSGLYMSADSLVRNCIVTNNGGDNMSGSGVYIRAGTVSNCVIRNNKCGDGTPNIGGGVYLAGGTVRDSIIADNTNSIFSGGGVYIAGGTVRNCVIQNNTVSQYGGGVYMNTAGALIESCTIVTNKANNASNAGGGVYRGNGTVRNCIVYLNSAPNNTANANYYATAGFEYSASDPQPPPTTGAGNIIAGVTFQDPSANDYRLKACDAVDAGTNQTWMVGATDLAGNPRKQWGGKAESKAEIVDMGAYEAPRPPPSGTVILLR